MSSRDAFAVGARLLAIFFAVVALSALANLPAAWELVSGREDVSSPWRLVLGPAAGAVIYLLASVLLWSRNPIPTSPDHPRAAPGQFYPVALSLLGVYLVVVDTLGLFESLLQAALLESTFLIAGAEALPHALGVTIGVLLVVHAKRLSAALAPA